MRVIVSNRTKLVASKYPEPGMLMACWVRGKWNRPMEST